MRRKPVLCTFWLGALAIGLVAAQPPQQKLLPADGTEFDRFGKFVALSGNTLFVSAPDDDSNYEEGYFAGSVYVFSRDDRGTWLERQELLASDSAGDADFGEDLALDGETALIGDYRANDSVGAVYVFTRDTNGYWTEKQKLLPSAATTGSRFGRSIAVEGDTALVGAEGDEGGAGAVFVFARDATGTWTEQQKIPGNVSAGDPAFPDRFGRQLALDGGTAIVGAAAENGGTGAAYVLTLGADGAWTVGQRLAADDGERGDLFGQTLALDGGTAIIGAFRDGFGTGSGSGSAYAFERGTDGSWSQTQKLTATGAPAFAEAIDIDAGRALIGAGGGSTFVFERSVGGVWTEVAVLTPTELAGGFGGAVALDDGTAVVGADHDEDNGQMSGSAWVFLLTRGIEIDIRPPSINPRSRGVVPVAILGSADFDVAEIDVETLRLGPGGSAPARFPRPHIGDVNGDGFDDLTVHFSWNRQIDTECGDSVVTLTGETALGQPFEGSDAVRTVGCWRRPSAGPARRSEPVR